MERLSSSFVGGSEKLHKEHKSRFLGGSHAGFDVWGVPTLGISGDGAEKKNKVSEQIDLFPTSTCHSRTNREKKKLRNNYIFNTRQAS